MPRLVAREGLTIENVLAPVRITALNPLVTGPLLFALLYDPQRIQSVLPAALDRILSSPRSLTWLKAFFAIGLLRKVNYYLSDRALNNSQKDNWRMGEEIVLVTGGSSGIGEGLVHELSKSSKAIIVLDLSPPKKPLPPNAFFYEADITNSTAISAVATKIRAEHGEPSVLINNAGIGSGGTILEKSEEMVHRIFNVNTISHFLTVKEFLPAMIKENHGHVVTMASMASFVASANMLDYSCTKASALAFHEGLASELKYSYGASKVRTTVVHPWWVRTPLTEKMTAHEKWRAPLLEPETVVDAVAEQLLSGKGGQLIIPGRLSFISGIRGFPSWLQEGIRNNASKQLAQLRDF